MLGRRYLQTNGVFERLDKLQIARHHRCVFTDTPSTNSLLTSKSSLLFSGVLTCRKRQPIVLLAFSEGYRAGTVQLFAEIPCIFRCYRDFGSETGWR